MAPRASTRDSEREVAEFARRASTFIERGRGRRFVRRDDSAKIVAEGEALSLRLDGDRNRVEGELAVMVQRADEPHVLNRVQTLTQELRAAQCQLQRLGAVLDDLR